MRFIVDHNVGKLVRWLRLMGFNSVFFTGGDDGQMVKQALAEDRILLTRDTGVMKRRLVNSGRVKAILLESENQQQQMRRLISSLDLKSQAKPFTLCLEDNAPLVEAAPAEVKNRVPPYVFKTQTQYAACPACGRVYWRGTHYLAMIHKLEKMYNDQE
jgi:uncharacterized protein